MTRLEIAYSVNKVCQFLSEPLESHFKVVKRILSYLGNTLYHGLLLLPSPSDGPVSLRAYGDPGDRRSTSVSCIYLGPNLISWSSKKQSLVARYSVEAEYCGLANATAELLWFQSLPMKLEIKFHPPVLLCGNQSAVLIAHNLVLQSLTKHLELDIHFVREKVLAKALSILHVPATGEFFDAFTKLLPASLFHALKSKLKVVPLPHLKLEEGVIEVQLADKQKAPYQTSSLSKTRNAQSVQVVSHSGISSIVSTLVI